MLAYRLKAETIKYAHMYEGENDKGSLTWIIRCNLTEADELKFSEVPEIGSALIKHEEARSLLEYAPD